MESGLVRPVRFVVALDCGPVSNPDGLRNQIEGGILQGTSRALVEEVPGTKGASPRSTGKPITACTLIMRYPRLRVSS